MDYLIKEIALALCLTSLTKEQRQQFIDLRERFHKENENWTKLTEEEIIEKYITYQIALPHLILHDLS